MDKILMQDFAVRVTQASKTELVVIMYEVILADIDSAKKAHSISQLGEFDRELKHACRFLNELMATLDYRIPMSHDLLSLYSFVNKSIVKAKVKCDTESLDEASMVIKKLHMAFAKISEQDTSGPVMQNVQQLYAGLTYGKGTLNESFLDPSQAGRGFVV